MPFTATGRYVEDVVRPGAARLAGATLPETMPVTTQTQQLSGLLSGAATPTKTVPTPGTVVDLPNPSVPTVNSGPPPGTNPATHGGVMPSTPPSPGINLIRGFGLLGRLQNPQNGGGVGATPTPATPAPIPAGPKNPAPGTVVDLPNPSVPTVTPTTTTPPPATPPPTTTTTPTTTPATNPNVPTVTPTTPPATTTGTPATPPAPGSLTTVPDVPAPTIPAPLPVQPNPATPYQMPDQPTPQDASVETRLNGLLQSDSPYMQLAREAGLRTANARGLLNSSIAAGNSEASAIAAAAPIASQDASQIAQQNETALQGWENLRTATTVQQLQDSASWQRLSAQLSEQLQQQGMSDTSAMQRLLAQGNISAAIQAMQDSNALTQTQINANVSLIGNYLNAFSALAQNPNIPASARDAYLAEYLRVSQQGQGLVNALSGVTVTWPSSTPGGTVTTPGTPVHGGEFYNGPSKDEILAMQHDGVKGNYAAAVAKWNQFFPDDPIGGSSSGGGNVLTRTFPSTSGLGILGGLLG